MSGTLRARRVALYGICLLIFAIGLLFGAARVTATSAARSLEISWQQLSSLRDTDPSPEEGLEALRLAQAGVAQADATLDRLDVRLVAALPVIGRSLDAERNVVAAAQEALVGAEVLAAGTADALRDGGGVDVGALRAMAEDLRGPVARAEAAYADLEGTSTALTPGIVRRGVEQAQSSLEPAVSGLVKAGQLLDVAPGLLGASEPRSVLVALENNAELRGTGGYVASFALGSLQDGQLSLGPLQDVAAVADPPSQARRVPAPAGFVEDYAALSGNSTIWRSWNMSPHVPDSALVGARVAGAILGEEPDIVILLDVPAMGALAALEGDGVALPDGTVVSPEDLTEALLVDAYARAGEDITAQTQRRAQLQAAATAVVSRLLGGQVEPVETVRTVASLVAGRHVKVWSAREEEQRVLEAVGVAGSVTAPADTDLLHVSINNVGANKIDFYVERQVDMEVVVGPDRAEVVQRVRLTNRAPEDLVPYVAGFEKPGTAISLVEFSLPVGSRLAATTVDGEPWTGTSRQGEERRRLATRIELPRGASTDLEVRYTWPLTDGRYRLRVVPQPLARDAQLSLTVGATDGWEIHDVDGVELQDETVEQSGPFDEVQEIHVAVQPRGAWERILRQLA